VAALERCATEWAAPKLAMRALVAEEGVVLKGQRSLPWIHLMGLQLGAAGQSPVHRGLFTSLHWNREIAASAAVCRL